MVESRWAGEEGWRVSMDGGGMVMVIIIVLRVIMVEDGVLLLS